MFNERTFHQHLLNFIIADDQVHFYYPLRLTLTYILVQSDLKETMILHHTKLQELIIEAWKQYFQVLKQDLMVPFSLSTLLSCSANLFLVQNATGKISFTTDIWSNSKIDLISPLRHIG
jgi:hypothetical protein